MTTAKARPRKRPRSEPQASEARAPAKAWIDGRVIDAAEARVPITDHGLLYGDGIFEGIRAFGGRVFRLDLHLARLAASARALALELPGGVPAMRSIVLDTVRAHGTPDAYIRLVVTRGEGALRRPLPDARRGRGRVEVRATAHALDSATRLFVLSMRARRSSRFQGAGSARPRAPR